MLVSTVVIEGEDRAAVRVPFSDTDCGCDAEVLPGWSESLT